MQPVTGFGDTPPEMMSAFPYIDFTLPCSKMARHFADILIQEQRKARYYLSFFLFLKIVLKDSKEAKWESELQIRRRLQVPDCC